jgi:hypothetical protein
MDPTQNPAGDAGASTNDNNDASEWDQAGLDFLSDQGIEPDKRKEEQGAIDEQAKSKEGDEEKGAPKSDPEGKKPDEKQGAGDDSKKGDGTEGEGGKPAEGEQPETPPVPTPEQADREYRRRQLELEADRKDLTEDIRKEMFGEKPARLEDADGDPIETIADVMRLQNPATGKPFTAEEATHWLFQAQRNFEKTQAEDSKKIAEIVEVNLNIKQQADSIKSKYGELLKHMPNLKAHVWAEYQKTLVKDEKSEIIIGAPVSMETFYDTILAPYMKQVEDLKKQAEADEQKTAEAEKRKKDAEEKKKQSQGDREDIFSTRTKIEDISDPEEKEWAKAAKDYYED